MFGTASGAMMAAPSAGADLPSMAVTLVTLSRPRTAASEQTVPGRLAVLTAKAPNEQPPVFIDPVKPASPLDTLAARLSVVPVPEPAKAKTPEPPPTLSVVAVAGVAPSIPSRGQAGEGRTAQRGAAGSSGGLWGQIEPCWRSLGGRTTVPVTLEVAVDIEGQLARPPTILRGGSVPDERRLTAEANALAALAACMPRGDLRFRGRIYRLEFRPG